MHKEAEANSNSGKLQSSSPFFLPGPPAKIGQADPEVLDFLNRNVIGTVLDLGGGLGAYSYALRKLGHDVTLAELDPLCLESARSIGIPVIDMNQTNLSDLFLHFDTVMLVEVLEHVHDHKLFLEKAARCARKKILLTVPCMDNFNDLFKAGLTYNHVAVSDHIHHFTSADIYDLFKFLFVKFRVHTGSPLFPGVLLLLMTESVKSNFLARLCLIPFRIAIRCGLVPRKLPTRIFVEAEVEKA